MEIYLSRFAGFCDGVKRAYDMVNNLNEAELKKPVFILGSLVHNPDVNRKIAEKGIKKIDRDFFFNAKPGQIGTLIITAHGVGPDIYEEAGKKEVRILDATCPKVVKAQRLAKVYRRRGYRIILVGDKNHKEVEGIDEWGDKKAIIVSPGTNLTKLKFGEERKIAVLAQTTQSEVFFKKVANFIKNKFPGAEITSTICGATHERQKEIKNLAKKCEAVVVIGSKTSANSTRLWEIAHSLNPKSYFIENAGELSEEWFSEVEKIAVAAGASTPEWIIEEVIKKIRKLR